MKFPELVEIVGDEPLFETGLLLAGNTGTADLHRQLSRWTRSGKLLQLRKGLYVLAPPFRKIKPHPFVVANRLVQGSYVSTQSALAFYGMIPEHVPGTTSVTTRRPGRRETPLGNFQFQHVRPAFFFAYRRTDLPDGQSAFVATPEKALLDLIHLQPGAEALDYLKALRLQQLEQINAKALQRIVDILGKPKLARAAARILELASEEDGGYEAL